MWDVEEDAVHTTNTSGPKRAFLIGVISMAGSAVLMGLSPSPARAQHEAQAATAEPLAAPATAAQGKEIVFDRAKGNCLACHAIDDGESPGNIGPPLVLMQTRFPDRAKLRAQIWDSTVANPESIMPPFGKHGILTGEEIDKIVAYLLTL